MLRATLHEQEIRRAIGAPGNGDRVVDGVATLDTIEDRCLVFISAKVVSDAVRNSLAARDGCIVIARKGVSLAGDCGVIECADPRAAIGRVLEFIRSENRQTPLLAARQIAPGAKISPLAVLEGNVEIGDDVLIEPFCVIGPDVRIGRGSIIRSGVRIFPRVSIGEECRIYPNGVLGNDCYAYVRNEQGNKTRFPHLGGLIIGSFVDVGASSTVYSGKIEPTIIEDYAKIGDLVVVAHNTRIGKNAGLCASSVVSGSAVVEADAWVGVNATIRDGLRVGTHALVGMDVSLQQHLPDKTVARAPRPDVRPRADDDDLTAIGFPGRS